MTAPLSQEENICGFININLVLVPPRDELKSVQLQAAEGSSARIQPPARPKIKHWLKFTSTGWRAFKNQSINKVREQKKKKKKRSRELDDSAYLKTHRAVVIRVERIEQEVRVC